ncbi:hypothetical protein [Burkholderia ubonensis]|uniref:hypothetical protein n=1 Tax=Burkholderia ubonensis TaxID=101571 RepID=UPI000AF60F40|nr:hypothetical protein [Burkholderia ubonensis]
MGQAKLKGTNREQRITALFSAHSVKALTRERYNAFVAWTRSPIATVVGEELEFLSTLDEHVIGVLIFDRTDRDYGYVSLGRDEKGRYRCIGIEVSMSRNDAQHALLKELKRHFDSGVKIFPQGDESDDKAGIDLFTPVVPEGKLSPTFQLIRSSDFWLPARSIMTEMMRHFHDVDGNFVEQFQTNGFDSRTWELYLYAALLEEGLFVEKPNPAPDFMVSLGRKKIFIEAVTVNPTANDPAPKPDDEPIFRSPEEIRKLNETKIPIKFGSPLWSKLTRAKPYWEMPDVAGHPLVFAIADFHEKQSMTWTSTALISYLYGVSHDFSRDEHGQLIISPVRIETHEYEGKQIPSGFFLQPLSENISAVLFSASGTISKFNRMGRLAGFGLPEHRMMRAGTRHKHDSNSALPEPFVFEIKQGEVTETWAEGLSMFHNPNAKYPVDRQLFPSIAHHYFEKGQIQSYLPEFHPYGSYTWNFMPMKDGKEKEL